MTVSLSIAVTFSSTTVSATCSASATCPVVFGSLATVSSALVALVSVSVSVSVALALALAFALAFALAWVASASVNVFSALLATSAEAVASKPSESSSVIVAVLTELFGLKAAMPRKARPIPTVRLV